MVAAKDGFGGASVMTQAGCGGPAKPFLYERPQQKQTLDGDPIVTQHELTPKQLRALYLNGTLRQRFRIAAQRVDRSTIGHPSTLVNAVSALEGFARAVAIKALLNSGTSLDEAYAYLRDVGPRDLITKHVCPAYGASPEHAFGAVAWRHIPEAIEFRNLLIHEATFLNGGTCKRLTLSALACFDKLGALAGAVA